jgi:hypothetical protein
LFVKPPFGFNIYDFKIALIICSINNLGEKGCGIGKKGKRKVNCDQPLCNTKELLEKSLFCLIKKKEDLETVKDLNKCEKECFIRRHKDGECKKIK